jgi:hypothetical protein
MAYPHRQEVLELLNFGRREHLDAENQIAVVLNALPGLTRDDFTILELGKGGARIGAPREEATVWRR